MQTDGSDAGCIICSGIVDNLAPNEKLSGGTSLAEAVYEFSLGKCRVCGHVQKRIDGRYLKIMEDLYKRNYELPGHKVNIIEGKVVNRETVLTEKMIDILNLGATGRFLDVGTGAGYLVEAFSRERPNWDVIAHDVGDRKKQEVLQRGASAFYSGELDQIPGTLDLIVLNHVVEHLTKPTSILKQVQSLLSPDGHAVVLVPNYQVVYTDFFFLEHCSHFTAHTLEVLATLADLKITKRLGGVVSPTEIGFVAKRADDTNQIDAAQAIAWAQTLPPFIRQNSKGRRVGIFGVNGAGMWLGAALKGEIHFFVDDDPSKQGHKFADIQIIGVGDIPQDSIVFVAYNNPEASQKMCDKLKNRRPDAEFLAPT